MATDQASADHEREQEKREFLADNQAEWAETETPPLTQPVLQVCAQCINWQSKRQLSLADGPTRLHPGFCTVRAAADLLQMPQAYAEYCQFYVEDMPF